MLPNREALREVFIGNGEPAQKFTQSLKPAMAWNFFLKKDCCMVQLSVYFLMKPGCKRIIWMLHNRAGSVGWAGYGRVTRCRAELTSVAKWPQESAEGWASFSPSSSVALSYAVCNSPTLFMHHLFSILQVTLFPFRSIRRWQRFTTLSFSGQKRLVCLRASAEGYPKHLSAFECCVSPWRPSFIRRRHWSSNTERCECVWDMWRLRESDHILGRIIAH
jgi:hypothetical protein